MTQVGSRAGTRISVSWAIDRLNCGQLAVLHAMTRLSKPTSLAEVRVGLAVPAEYVDDTVRHLHEIALVWGCEDALHVVREVHEVLRGSETNRCITNDRIYQPPPVPTNDVNARRVAHACAGTALELVQSLEHLLSAWSDDPPAVLRSGGIGVRDLRAGASLLGIAPQTGGPPESSNIEFVVELAQTAGLLARGEHPDSGEAWLPTVDFDAWREQSIAERWGRLADAWLHSAGGSIRRLTLRVVNGVAPLAYADEADVLAVVRWHAPRSGEHRDAMAQRALREAALLGIVAMDSVTPAGAALVSDDDAVKVMDDLMPAPVDHVLVQADLTAIAPGPLERDLARRLGEIAQLESRGGATVFRFTAESVRSALDLGWPADQIHAFVADCSHTPIPQPLTYLIDDVARRHGCLRVGQARGYVRCDDPTELDAMLADATLVGLSLHRIAPTVALTDLPVPLVLDRLRGTGRIAVSEGADGGVQTTRPATRRSRVEPAPITMPRDPRDVVAAIRAGDAASDARPADASQARLTRTGSMYTVAALREAAEAQASVWLSYMDQAGSMIERIVDPVRVEAGWLTAYDHRSAKLQSFAVHRISQVAQR